MIHEGNSLILVGSLSLLRTVAGSRSPWTSGQGTVYPIHSMAVRDNDASTAQCTGGNIKRVVQPDPWFASMARGDRQLAARVPDNIAAEAGSKSIGTSN